MAVDRCSPITSKVRLCRYYVVNVMRYPAIITKTLTNLIYIHKKILRVKINVWQTLIAPIVACIATWAIGYLMKILIFDTVLEKYNIIAAIVSIVLIIVFLLIFGYFPIHALLGGWDDYSMRDLRKAVAMSGPSKFIVYPMFKMIEAASRISPLHNKFKIDSSEAVNEIAELLELKKQSVAKAVSENKL